MSLKKKSIKSNISKKGVKSSESVKREEVSSEIIDSQKEFFDLMARKIKEDTTGPSRGGSSGNIKSPCVSRVPYYRKMIWRFSFLIIVLVVSILYFFIIKLDVVVETDERSINDSLNFYAYSDNTQVNLDRAVKAGINRVELDIIKEFPSTGKENLGGQITGKVRIINNYSKNQPLVATTRLLTPDNKLFRIKKTVNVPAGGSIEADIYADQISPEMAIAPSKFIIPGLWEGIQDQIYAESYEAFKFNQDVLMFISQSDIDDAIKTANQEIIKKAQDRATNSNSYQKNIFNIDPSSIEVNIDNKVGDKVESFFVKIKAIVNVITLNKDDVDKIIKQKLSILDFNQERSQIDSESLKYELLSFNPSKSLAEIKVSFSAKTMVANNGELIKKEHLLNLNERQLRVYLDSLESISSYDLVFIPNFFKRAPMLINRITISYK